MASSSTAWCGWSYDTTEWVSLNHPSPPLPAPSAPTISTIEVHMPALFSQVLVQEPEYLLPAVQRLLDAVSRTVVVEETMPGAVVAVKLVLFAVLLEFGLVLVHLLRGRRAIFIAEQAEQRAGEVLGKFDRRGRLLRVQLLLAHHHPTAPQFARSVYAFGMASKQEGLPPA